MSEKKYLGEVIIEVRCRNCGYVQNTKSVKSVRCQRCGKNFQVIKMTCKEKPSCILRIVKGSFSDYIQKVHTEKFHKTMLY